MFGISTAIEFETFFWLLVLATLVAMLGRYIRVPYALALVITGLLLGPTHLLPQIQLNPQVLFTIFLPPLLFESAMNMRVPLLLSNWRSISIYALAGTLLAAFVTGWLAHRFLGLPLAVGLVFGALIAPTDPISVIAIFKELGVGKRLSLIMEAESVFNDGVAIVLFTMLAAAMAGQETTLIQGMQSFFLVVMGGALIGTGIGLIASRITREFNDHLLEIMLTTVVAFGTYLAAESFHVSGVIAVVCAGFVMGSYGMQTGMSPTTRLSVASFWEWAAFAVNSMVFLLVGLEVTLVDFSLQTPLILVGVFIVLAGRAVSIYGLTPIINAIGGDIPSRWRHVLFWGGLRGAIPMALVLSLGNNFPHRGDLLVLTFGVVLCSLLIQGLTTKQLLRKLNLVTQRGPQEEFGRISSEIVAIEAALKEIDDLKSRRILSETVYLKIKGDYEQRLSCMEKNRDQFAAQNDIWSRYQESEARRLAIHAEKSALREAYRSGLLEEEDLQDLMAKLDQAVLELEKTT